MQFQSRFFTRVEVDRLVKESAIMSIQTVQERTAKLFYNRHNQSVRFPKGFELDADEVTIRKDGESLVITPKPRTWDEYFDNNTHYLSDDFPDQIEELPPQIRDSF